jgi:murein DD-endopeptidase MepM/ murein hydrolase activator NlpD
MKKEVFILSISLLFGIAFSQECKYHKVKSGESLEKIAKSYGVSLQELLKANKNIKPNKLKVGENLCIPQKTSTKTQDYAIYKVKKGDTLQSIAEKFGVDVQELKSFNNLKSEKVKEGQELKIPAKGTAKKQKKETQEYGTYVVQRGAKLEHVAKKLGVSQRELEELNPELKGKWLKKGTVVKVPVKVEEKRQAVRPAEKPLEERVEEKRQAIRPVEKPSEERKQESTSKAESEMPQEKRRENAEVKISKNSLPMPVDGKVSKNGRGINISTDCGKPVKAVDNGRVIYSGGDLKAYGNMVIVDHGDFISIYAYNEKNLVKRGDSVSRGQQIALVGRKNEGEECTLYFELRSKEGVPLDPTEYIRNTQ